MALIFSDIWGGGQREQIGPGWHYKKNVKSLVVPEGEVVTIYENEDRTGAKSWLLYEGEYRNMVFYGTGKSGIVLVERTPLTLLDMVEIGWNHQWGPNANDIHPMHLMIPVGDRNYNEDFPGDKIQWVRIPYGLTVEAFVDPGFQGGSLMMSGNVLGERELWHLSNFESKTTKYNRFSWNVSSMRIRSDKWVAAGIELRNVEIDNSSGEKFAGVTELANNTPHSGTISKEIEWTKEKSVEENWNIEAGITAKAGFEAETMGITVTGELEVSVSGGYGETKSTEESRSITDTVSATVEAYGNVKVSTIIDYGKMTADAIRKWRNVRTNDIIEQPGRISCSWSNDARHEISGTPLQVDSRREDD